MTPKPVGYQLIANDLKPILPRWITAETRWELTAHSQIRNGFATLLTKHAEFQRLHPET